MPAGKDGHKTGIQTSSRLPSGPSSVRHAVEGQSIRRQGAAKIGPIVVHGGSRYAAVDHARKGSHVDETLH